MNLGSKEHTENQAVRQTGATAWRMNTLPLPGSILCVLCALCGWSTAIFSVTSAAADLPLGSPAQTIATNFAGWSTNAPAVYALVRVASTNASRFPPPPGRLPPVLLERVGRTNVEAARAMQLRFEAAQRLSASQPVYMTNQVFDHFLAGSLNNLVWTNLIAHTNGRSLEIWSVRSHPLGWPARPPIVAWNANGLMWGMKGLTALSPCWEGEGSSGQVPITALTRRHGYTRGHSMGLDGFRTDFAGRKVWFVTTNHVVVEATMARGVVRTSGSGRGDYTLLLFQKDLPPSIEPIRVVAITNLFAKYAARPGAPWPLFGTEQTGHVSAGLPELSVSTWKGGDSGSPNMLPLPGELVFYSGRTTASPSPAMQADMDALCAQQGLPAGNYQLQWVDLSAFPSY